MAFDPATIQSFRDNFFDAVKLTQRFEPAVCTRDPIPTIGFGYMFVRRSGPTYTRFDQALEELAEATGQSRPKADFTLLDEIANALNDNDPALAHRKSAQFAASIGTITEPQARTLFDFDAVRKEGDVRARFCSELGAAAGHRAFRSLANSRELIALMDLAYNDPSLVSGSLTRAIRDGNWAEAWFEIRYNSNNGDSRIASAGVVLQKRRIIESEIFGLYGSSPAYVPAESAQQVFRMVQLHRERIRSEETYWAHRTSSGQTALALAIQDGKAIPQLLDNGQVRSLSDNLDIARNALLEWVSNQDVLSASPISASDISEGMVI